MTVEEARAALAEAQAAFDAAKGTGVSKVAAASRALSAAKRALAAAEKAEAAGVNISGLSRAEQLSTLRQAEYTVAQEEAGRTEKPPVPPADEFYTYDYVWRSEPGGRGGYWSKVQFPRVPGAPLKTGSTGSTGSTDSTDSTDSTGSTTKTRGVLPEGFTPGNFPKELEKWFGAPPSDILGWKLTEYTDGVGGKKYYRLSISQKGAYGDAISGSSEFGAAITKDESGNWVPYVTSSSGKTDTDSTTNTNISYQFSGGKLYSNGNLFSGSYNGQTYENGILKTSSTLTTSTTAGVMTAGQQDIYSIVVDRLNRYNLGSLAPLIKKLAIEGATEATIMLRLQDEPLYQERFKANQSRIQKGLKVLSPSEYLTLEDDYRQVLRAYGLTQFDNDAYVSQFLANDVSVSELSNRVVAAVQRVRNADPAVSAMLKNYYGISNNDLVAYVLDPNQQFQKIERQIAASEIGVAAGRQGFNIGVPVAEQLAAQGITQAEAQRGYATIADILPTAEKLSDIYGATLEGYGLAEGEQEVFNQLASAQRKRQRLTQREVAEFSGQSGLARGGLAQTQQRGQF